MKIELAKLEQIEEIKKIYEIAKLFMRENGNNVQWINGYPSLEQIRVDILNHYLYVIYDDESIVGVFALIIGVDPSYNYIEGSWLNDEEYGTIHRIASNFRKKGILECAVDYAFTKTSNVRIDTHEKNIPMQNAIKKLGFTECGIIYLVSDNTPRLAYQKKI